MDPLLPMIRFETFKGVSHGISMRHGGVSRAPYESLNLGVRTDDSPECVRENQQRFLHAVGSPRGQTIFARLVHGREVSVFQQKDRGSWPVECVAPERDSCQSDRTFHSDGVVSDVPGLRFLLTFADCVPLLFVDRRRGAMGAAHAGWRGTALGVGPAVIRAMQSAFGSHARDLEVAIGPSIGPCCYTVGPEVATAFEQAGNSAAFTEDAGRSTLDLWASNERQLIGAGVRPESISNHRICTACTTDHFFSHRAEGGVTGRFALCIGLL